MNKIKKHRLYPALILTTGMVLPALAMADGHEFGVEGGVNFENAQNINGGPFPLTLHFKTGFIGGLTYDYAFANGLRPELELAYRSNNLKSASKGAASASAGGQEQALTGMLNLWYDYKSPTGLLSVVHPYIGGGVGGVRLDARHISVATLGSFGSDYDALFAYQGGAGLGYDVAPHWNVSLDYRYIESNRGNFYPGSGISARYRANTIMVGLKYALGAPPPPAPEAPAPVAAAAPPPPPPPPARPACNPPPGFKVDANCHIIEQSVVLRAVDFEFNSDRLTGPAQASLDQVAGALAQQSDLVVEVQGHTDSVGSAPYNLKLSQRRADAVKAYLVSKGADSSRLTAKGYGKTHPIASNDTDEGRTLNRRVEFEVGSKPAGVKVINEGASSASTSAAEQGAVPAPAKKKRHHKAAPAPATPQ